MVTQDMLRGQWKEIKGKLHARWGQLTDDELEQAHGNVEQLVGAIQRKTGAAREEIEKYLDDVAHGSSGRTQQAAEVVQQYTHAASEYVQGAVNQAAEAARERYAHAQEVVQQRPLESLATCFGIGLVTGVLVGLMLRSR